MSSRKIVLSKSRAAERYRGTGNTAQSIATGATFLFWCGNLPRPIRTLKTTKFHIYVRRTARRRKRIRVGMPVLLHLLGGVSICVRSIVWSRSR
jgi:hypothetical protein